MNNEEFYNELFLLVQDGLLEINRPHCETKLLKTSKQISDLIFNRKKEAWCGEEMLGKLIIKMVNGIIIKLED